MRYEKPVMEILELIVTDILTVSGDGTSTEEGGGPSVDFGS